MCLLHVPYPSCNLITDEYASLQGIEPTVVVFTDCAADEGGRGDERGVSAGAAVEHQHVGTRLLPARPVP